MCGSPYVLTIDLMRLENNENGITEEQESRRSANSHALSLMDWQLAYSANIFSGAMLEIPHMLFV